MSTSSTSLDNFRNQIVLALALMLFGFGMMTQLRSYVGPGERLEAQKESDLVEIVDSLDTEIRLRRSELTDQQIKLVAFAGSEGDNQEVIDKIQSEIVELEMFVGKTMASGAGITIKIRDRQHLLTGFDLRQIIEELRASGAWAIALNGKRIDIYSSFWRKSGYVYLDKSKLKPDFNIQAVGEPNLLFQAITLPRGIRDKLSTLNGVNVNVRRKENIDLPSFDELSQWRFAEQVVKQ